VESRGQGLATVWNEAAFLRNGKKLKSVKYEILNFARLIPHRFFLLSYIGNHSWKKLYHLETFVTNINKNTIFMLASWAGRQLGSVADRPWKNEAVRLWGSKEVRPWEGGAARQWADRQ
jgi:hypothetical protein